MDPCITFLRQPLPQSTSRAFLPPVLPNSSKTPPPLMLKLVTSLLKRALAYITKLSRTSKSSTILCDIRRNSLGTYLFDTGWGLPKHIHIKDNNGLQYICKGDPYHDNRLRVWGLHLLRVYRGTSARKVVAIANESIFLRLHDLLLPQNSDLSLNSVANRKPHP
jgi:hypothetical protein